MAVAWEYQTRLAEFDISMRTSTRGSYFDMEHITGDMNYFLNRFNVKTKQKSSKTMNIFFYRKLKVLSEQQGDMPGSVPAARPSENNNEQTYL